MPEFKKDDILLESGTNELEVMEFIIADQHYGINVSKVVEIMRREPVTAMPNSNPYVEGVFNQRDFVLTLINLAAYLGLPPSEDEERDIFIIAKFNNIQTAFHVHNVEGIHRLSWTDIEKPDRAIYGGVDSLATGIAKIEGRLVTIIDFERILADINPSSGIQLSDLDQLGSRERSEKKILIAEDSLLLEKMIVESLDKAGYSNVVCCANGKEAWDKLLQYRQLGGDVSQHVSCVITDIEMPQMDGHHLLKRIRDDAVLRVLPVIVFSSLITDEMRIKGESLKATAQIAKPDILDLVALIDQYVL